MSEGNGTDVGAPLTSRRVLVVGGMERNIPIWARRAFTIELVDQNQRGGKGKGKLEPQHRPDAIVVVVKQVSHNFSGQAHDIGREWNVPVLKARDGWSSAVQSAAHIGVDWFVDAVQQAGEALTLKNPPRAVEALQAVDNAWKGLAVVARQKSEAIEKRMRKQAARLAKVEGALARIQDGAEQRIVEKLAQRAAQQRRDHAGPVSAEVLKTVRRAIGEFDAAHARARAQLVEMEERLEERLKERVDSAE